MGIPKFFQYISERYPCLTEKLKDYQIPEFDNLYLDVNGIIHVCSHPDDANVMFRITEETIFNNIFRYIELLFRMIQPQRLFFVAIDGVAPRAKINQQRSRRFRAAKDAEIQELKAKAKGLSLPTEKRFDSNCITPGTLFMAKLDEQLKYFITYKISTDKLWQKCKVIFSGSQVPGEGEHKIMDYIRYMKSQPDYDIHTKHCLYGLDADLIMLGLCTHEVNFTLLREEITFGKKHSKTSLTPEETKFCLFHLSLLREYIDHEFSSLKEKLAFPYDLEKVIDDWVLMGFLIGNDFIPHLPNLHIVHGAFSVLYQVYMDVLPTLDGYINETGTLRLDRFEKFMERLSRFDILRFSDHYADIKYLESKTGKPLSETERVNATKSESSDETASPKRAQQDREFDALLRSAMEMSKEYDEEGGDDDSDPEIYAMEFVQRKKDYYMNKLNYETIDEDFLRAQAEGYVRAIQWNLNYYYNGCCSWSWYYPHHYAPYISDIKDFKDLKLEFDLGEPFLPFEQLLAVLPPYSKELLPSAFQSLLTEEQSPIKNYYPMDFETDLNGKQQEWEAVVLIPFIDEKHLLDAIASCSTRLTAEERARNRHGPMCVFTYTEENLGVYKAPEYLPDVVSHARVQLINREDIIVPREKLVRGLCPGVKLDVYYPGFPTLQHIEHTVTLEKAKVRVHQRQSLRDSMVLHITPPPQTTLRSLGQELLGSTVFVNWPHMKEAVVVAVSDDHMKINLVDSEVAVTKEFVEIVDEDEWNAVKKRITDTYKGHLAVEIGATKFLVHVRMLLGNKHTFGTHGNVRIEKQLSELPAIYAYQTVVKDVVVSSNHVPLLKSIDEIFVPGSMCFMLGHPYYGASAKVCESGVCKTSGRVKVSVVTVREPPFKGIKHLQMDLSNQYMSGSVAAQKLGMSGLLLSRVTGTMFVKPTFDGVKQDDSTLNIGLNLKFTKRNAEILGYTRKTEDGHWFYSPKAIELIRSYMLKYPVLFERLAQNPSACIFQEEDLFSKGTNELTEVVAWLKEQLQGTETRTCGTMTVESSIVKKLEEQIDAYVNSTDSAGKAVEMQVQPYLLYMPGLHLRNLPPDPKTHTMLLDRICCTKDNFTVPLGYKGTVIGIQKMETAADTMYDVLFDKPFVGGLSINGSSDNRAYRLSALDFINITHGERIAHSKATLDVGMDATEARKSGHESQRRASASAFASYKNENHFGTDASMSSKPRIIHKNADRSGQIQRYRHNVPNAATANIVLEPYRTRNPLPPPPVLPSPNLHKRSSAEPTSEFQAIWNELHKKQVPHNHVQKTSVPPKVKHYKDFPGNSAPQDPSAFLKAVLKISDGNVQQTAQKPVQHTAQKSVQKVAEQPVQKVAQLPVQKLVQQPVHQPVQQHPQPGTSKAPKRTNSVQKENKAQQDNTPPLVQQLFDHARQNEKAKDEKTPIWYCSQLLNYHQLSGVGMPRYTYFADPETKLIQAHILLPDKRIFIGDPCVTHEQAAGSAAKKVYTELKLANVLPNMKILLPPQHWYSNPQNTNWSQNVRQPAAPNFYPPESTLLQLFPEWVQKGLHNTGHQHTSKQNDQYNNHYNKQYNRPKPSVPKEQKPGMSAKSNNPGAKNFPTFVPLQAIKKSRNVTAKQQSTSKEVTTQSAKDNPRPVTQPKNTESTTQAKATKVEATGSSEKSVQNGSNEIQNTQQTLVIKPKKSRVAARFGLQTQTEENNHNKSSSST